MTKARIVEAVREAKGDPAAEAIAPLKKGEMAEKAQALLAGTRWLPTSPRTPGQMSGTGMLDPAAESLADPEPPAPDHRHDAEPPVEHWQVAAEYIFSFPSRSRVRR